MPIPLGILAVAGAGGGAAAGAYEQIETQILTGTTTSITFSSIPSTYKHLQIRAVVRGGTAATNDRPILRLNGVTTSSYAEHRLVGAGSGVNSTGAASQDKIQHGLIPGNSGTTNSYAAMIIDILDSSVTTKNKTIRTLMGGHWNSFEIALVSGALFSTNAITSATLGTNNGSFATGSRFSLYGIKG
jgi:hypothetical protein